MKGVFVSNRACEIGQSQRDLTVLYYCAPAFLQPTWRISLAGLPVYEILRRRMQPISL